MICIGVIPCLSNGLAKNNKIMSMFVLFFRRFWPFREFGFFSKMREGGGGTNLTPKQSNVIF